MIVRLLLILFFLIPGALIAQGLFDDMVVFEPVPKADTCAISSSTGNDNHDDHSSCGGETSDSHDDHSSCGGETDSENHDGHDHGAHDHSAHGGSSIFAMPDSKRKASRCEHNMATADCKECSSEVGVVHVSKEMIKETAGKTQSLIGTNKVEEIAVDDIVDTIGQVSLPENDIAHISPRVDGTIRKVFVNLGDKVTIGDRLFQLVSTEIGRSAAAYKKASALVRLASQELARGKKMQKLKVTSDKEVFRLSYELEQASIERASARQELEILGISKAQIDSPVSFKELSRGIVTVTAPVNGSITEKHAVIGEVVSPGESVLIISNLTRLWVWARIYDSNIGLILANRSALKNKEASIRVAAFPGKKFSGTIDYISPIIDKETRTLNLRLTVPNDDGKLLPGMFCRIELPLGQHKIIAVPRYSVLNDGETDFVFVPFGKNTFAAKEVKVGSIHDDHLPVLKGLSKGDTIVTRGTFILKSEVLKERMGAG